VEPSRRHLEIVYAVSSTLRHSLDLDEVLTTALEALTHVTGHEISSLHLLSSDGATLVLGGDRGLSERLRAANLRLAVGEGIIGGVVQDGQTVVFERVLDSPRLLAAAREAVRADGILGFVCVAIRARDRIVGAISLGRQVPEPFTADEVRLLEVTADQIGVAIENARLHAETRRQLDELRRAQAQLIHAEKLAAVGQLAAGVAHEINSPLTTILGEAQLLAMSPIGEQIRDRLRLIAQEGGRAARLIQNLLLFARQYPPERTLCHLRDQVTRILDLKAHQFHLDSIRVITEFEPCPAVWADENQIQQVLLNLIQNAHQAMAAGQGGVLGVRVRPVPNGVRVEVADDGPGIPLGDLERVFEPFYTTKPAGEGSGLGLSVSLGIVSEHGGRLWAENRPEGGAVFYLELPIGSARAAAPAPAKGPLPTRPLRALLVEDEQQIADVLSNLLRSLGHTADVAHGPSDGLVRTTETAYDVAFVDLGMPGRNGRIFWEKLKASGSPLAGRTVFMTGNPRSLEAREVEAAGALVLAKPFTVQELAAVLRAATQVVAVQ
jgi:signal transduction histidine kinase/ActR/RegA family two-component response regulator